MSLSIIIASGGRPTLARTIQSIVPQLDVTDEIIVVVDQAAPWGHASRNRAMRWAKGEWLMFTDDDDTVADGALAVVRAAVRQAPNAAHIFKMAYSDGRTIWTDREVRLGNVSTQMIVCPNREPFGVWNEAEYAGDYPFIKGTCQHRETIFHEEVIAHYRPA